MRLSRQTIRLVLVGGALTVVVAIGALSLTVLTERDVGATEGVQRLAALGAETEGDEAEMGRYSALVRMIQLRLAERGLYLGQVDGVMSPATQDAIRAYQRLVEIEPDGRPSTPLLARLNSTEGAAKELLDRLDAARKAQIEEARVALIREFGPEWATPKAVGGTAARAGDAETCFTTPEPACLITLALASAQRIEKEDLRDWALSHVVEAQACAGLRADALETARSIADPRSVIAAVGAIAVALANSGQTEEATKAAERVPDRTLRDKALRAVAEGQVTGGNPVAAAATAKRISAAAERVPALVAAARGLAAAGKASAADGLRDEAVAALASLKTGSMRDFVSGELAVLEAELGRAGRGKTIAGEIDDKTKRTRALAEIAVVEIRSGARDDARATLKSAEATLTCAVDRPECQHAHARLAIAGAELGGYDAAMRVVQTLRAGYTQSFAHREVAIATARSGAADEAERIALSIPQPRVRLEALLGIAETRAEKGDASGAHETGARAMTLAHTLENPIERAFALIDLALIAARRGDNTANGTLKEATDIARALDDPFGRSRSLSRIATALAVLRGG